MNFLKKLIISVVIILFTYILWKFIKRKQTILHEIETQKKHVEQFSMPTVPNLFGLPSQSAELTNIKSSVPIQVQNISTIYGNLPLREYCIKGSYNSAYTGNYINLDMVEYVLSRGCRFLDFEVYYIKEKDTYVPKVGYSTDNTFTLLESENSILLDNVLAAVVSNGFSNKSPNNNDPLFINLRIKSNNHDVYNAVAKSIDYSVKSKLYKGAVTNDTKLNDIMGNVVIVIDKTINRDYKEYTSCKDSYGGCYDLTEYSNMESGSEALNIVKYLEVAEQCNVPITILDKKLHTDVKKMRLALPNIVPAIKHNPILVDFITKYGCQITPNRFYHKDANLKDYEQFFDDNKSAFVPLSVAMNYFQKLKERYA
jgi:hypothetical protein